MATPKSKPSRKRPYSHLAPVKYSPELEAWRRATKAQDETEMRHRDKRWRMYILRTGVWA